jgi:WD repeat-containing protein 48
MGKLKALGKQKKAGASDASETQVTPPIPGITDAEKVYSHKMCLQVVLRSHQIAETKVPPPTLLQTIMSKPLNLPDFSDVPPIDINSMTGIVISQVASEAASGWTPVYRGLYSTQAEDEDIDILEHELPAWVLEFLLGNTVGGVVGGGGPTNGQKFSFIVVPWRGSDSSEELPELLSNQTRLTASRWLRVRKILTYVSYQISTSQCSSQCSLL